ncbi:hypothetical protein [Luteibacter rhizovicinus]|uniref:hypothetical protein n=1 Tax=Luteibacter rhizovicinus TaxID=242606 RepID=UPI000F7A845B|nr:hypothetical protein [Luteibacter rhizovicinus]
MSAASLSAAGLAVTASPLHNSTTAMASTTSAGSLPPVSAASVAAPAPSVTVTLSGTTAAAAPAVYGLPPIKAAPVWQDAGIAITTASGRSITLSLQDDGSIAIATDGDAPLSDAETAATAKLSTAFKSALDGMASAPPRLDLDGLAQVDTRILSSVHLAAQAVSDNQAIQTIDFRGDATTRAVKIEGLAGKIDVSVDLSSPAIAGSKTQQASAIANVLKQFDQAASRGHANPALMSMFKDAFTQMSAPGGLDTPGLTRSSSWLDDTDHALLSGLADFTASITQTATAPNPYRSNEHDAFSFQTSQRTQVTGRNATERGISQITTTQLHASFHSALSPDAPLNLTDDPKSQNYYFTQIADDAQSNLSIGYRKGQLVKASLTQTANQSTDRLKYVMGQKVEDVTTPLRKSQQRDLLPLLQEMERHPPQTARERDARTRDLASLHDSVLLRTDPVSLA